MTIRPRATAMDGKRYTMPYQWVIEGDIKGCFDHIDHHALMQRIRHRVADRRVNRLVVQFLKAGVLMEEQFIQTPTGTPQGGILSPLLANIALSAIEERYERWVHHRSKIRSHRQSDGLQAAMNSRSSDRRAGRPVFFPIRYADDFVILVSGQKEEAQAEKAALADYLQETLGLELSADKTRITALTAGFEFLGHRIRLLWHPQFGYMPRVEIPKAKTAALRYRVKQRTRRDRTYWSLSRQLQELNPILRGWGNFYRYCTNAKEILTQLDWYVGDRLWRWMRKKFPKADAHEIARWRQPITNGRQKVWCQGPHEQFLMGRIPIRRYRRGWMGKPDYAVTSGKPDA